MDGDGGAEVTFDDDGETYSVGADEVAFEEAAEGDENGGEEEPAETPGGESEGDSGSLSVGSRVLWDNGEESGAGEIQEIDDGWASVLFDDDPNQSYWVDESELSSEADGDEGGDETYAMEKGDRVVVEVRGKDRAGEVQSVNQGKGTCRVKLDHNKKTQGFKQSEVDFETDE